MFPFRLFRVYGSTKTTGSHITSTTPEFHLDRSTEPDRRFPDDQFIEISSQHPSSTADGNDIFTKRTHRKSYIEKLIRNIERLNKNLRHLNKKSFDNDDRNSAIDVYNFYQMAYPRLKPVNDNQVSF